MQESFTDTESAMLPVMGGWLFAVFKALEAKRQAGMEQLGFQLTVGTLLAVSYTDFRFLAYKTRRINPPHFTRVSRTCALTHTLMARLHVFMCSSVTLLESEAGGLQVLDWLGRHSKTLSQKQKVQQQSGQ